MDTEVKFNYKNCENCVHCIGGICKSEKFCDSFWSEYKEIPVGDQIKKLIDKNNKQVIEDTFSEVKKLLNVKHHIEGYGDMIYALDLEIALGLLKGVENDRAD